jgi:hypothetical protein
VAIPHSQPIRFTPKGLTDAFDSTDEFKGACQALANLIFDQANPECIVPRPGVQLLTAALPTGAGFVSVHASIGTRVYGMVSSTLNAGKDEPFCYETVTGTLVPITGVTNANSPTSPGTTGDWIPPTMASIGVYIIVTHPGFSGTGANFFGVINLTNPLVPVWSSANTATNALTARPDAVANFNNRAYFAVGNQLQFSDPLNPLNRASATQALVVGDSAALNALSGLPLQTTSSGVVGALVAWKQSQVWQVTGDSTTSDLALNFISLTVGTSAPRSIAQSPAGLYFLSLSSPYFIDPLGTLRLLTYRADSIKPDVSLPFINAIAPTRWAGCYSGSIYRVCGPTEINGELVTNDYWFDERRRRWNGPHSFPYDCASAMGGFFVLSSYLNPGQLLTSSVTPLLSSLYNDLGNTYTVQMQSATFPKTGDMCQKQVAESQIELGSDPGGATYTITAQDEGGDTLDSLDIVLVASSLVTWGGGALWGGGAVWAGAQNKPPRTYPVPWSTPLVFEKMQLSIVADASAAVRIGTFFARYQQTGYMTPGPTP